ncbi:hypothetical protein Pan189_42310 [Stratiformator vulcanicus]|uniref:Uncharacterized protein n=2 Tax=Stratiformator vulcanicus TaxID=2527980 RepID=A0A517R7F9_9PLAN|nr:hypothetical protein Pan189_42310 [Stratiformator vulcanicus]
MREDPRANRSPAAQVLGLIIAIAAIEILTIWMLGLGVLLSIAMIGPLAKAIGQLRRSNPDEESRVEKFGRIMLAILIVQSVTTAGITVLAVACYTAAIGAVDSSVASLIGLLGAAGVVWLAAMIWMYILASNRQIQLNGSDGETPADAG